MASLAKDYTQQKLFGQVYTPNFVVSKILDEMGYDSYQHIVHRTILDPACGDGQFLIEVVRRLINYMPVELLEGQLHNVFGWDIDPIAINKAKENLDELVSPLGLNVPWNLECVDSLQRLEIQTLFNLNVKSSKFSYIVGNPPYIRIQHLDTDIREYIKKSYSFCKSGSTDSYIAFFELCDSLLASDGVCGLITPNTYFYTETARPLRHYFVENKGLIKIINYGNIQLFDGATTYSAITIYDKKKHSSFLYEKAVTCNEFEQTEIDVQSLGESFWQLSTDKDNETQGIKLGELAQIHVGIATLCDKVYIFSTTDDEPDYVVAHTKIAGDVKIERGILKPIIKGSTLKSNDQAIKEWVLFPYKNINGKNEVIPQAELEQKYPLAYNYLCSMRKELDKRDNGKPNSVAWYAFGRSQGLDTSFGKKIIFSPMNAKPNFIYSENEDCTFYSGYCIKCKYDMLELLFQLNSGRMQKYIEISSRDYRGGWKAYNKKVVENYIIER